MNKEILIVNSFLELQKIKKNVVLITITKKSVLDIESFKKLQKAIIELTENQNFHLITDITNFTTEVTPESRKALEEFQKENRNFKSCAIVLNSAWKSILLGTFLSMIKMQVPTKSFSSIDSALDWIDSL